jgi:hypothetical protein
VSGWPETTGEEPTDEKLARELADRLDFRVATGRLDFMVACVCMAASLELLLQRKEWRRDRVA